MNKNKAVLTSLLVLSPLTDAWAQHAGHNHDHHHSGSHSVSIEDAEFRAPLPKQEDSWILIDIDTLANGQPSVRFYRSLSPVAGCHAFDTLGLPLDSTKPDDLQKARLHVINHMGGATPENIKWMNDVLEYAQTLWQKKYGHDVGTTSHNHRRDHNHE